VKAERVVQGIPLGLFLGGLGFRIWYYVYYMQIRVVNVIAVL
jgi:hypothetical protein